MKRLWLLGIVLPGCMDSLFKPEEEPEPYPPYYEPAPYYEPEPYREPEPPVETVFSTVLLFDWDGRDQSDGRAGVDFCGIVADCANAVSAELILGDGLVCDVEGPDCPAVRTDPNAVLDLGEQCVADSVPSDYVSLGQFGALYVGFDGDLRGCSVAVVTLNNDEGWEAYVCDSGELGFAYCLADGGSVHLQQVGGSAIFLVPAE
jgi:hypothetical protein